MKADRNNLVMILTLMILGACLGSALGQTSPVDQIIFPHDIHFDEDLECLTCHEGAEASQAITERFFPDMDVCSDCHDVDDEDNCTMCHTSPDDAGYRQDRVYGAQVFSHSAHLGQDLQCAACHGDPAAQKPQIPAKPDCRTCHNTADFYADCRLCHADPERPVPTTHRGDWLTSHGLPAQSQIGRCYLCHTESTCQECHNGDNVRPRSHGLNYRFGHSIAARGNELECAVCHTEPEYCSSCHVAERVMPTSHSKAGWVNLSTGGRHALDAPFELENCIACHDSGASSPTCAACHGG